MYMYIGYGLQLVKSHHIISNMFGWSWHVSKAVDQKLVCTTSMHACGLPTLQFSFAKTNNDSLTYFCAVSIEKDSMNNKIQKWQWFDQRQ